MSREQPLRMDALVGKRVVDRDGRSYGRVSEIQMDDDADPPTIAFLLAGSAALVIRLGLRGRLRQLIRRRVLAYRVPWTSVAEIGAEIVVDARPPRWR